MELSLTSVDLLNEYKDGNEDSSFVKYTYLHSRANVDYFTRIDGTLINIKKEVDVKNLPNGRKPELFIILGFSTFEEINELIHLAHPDSVFFVIDTNPSFLAHYMKQNSYLEKANIVFIIEPLERITKILAELFSTRAALLLPNLRIYTSFFYRNYDVETYKSIASVVATSVRYRLFTLGNSVEDSLSGLINNVKNIKHIAKAKDITRLKNKFSNVPAFIVSAGPSLDRNIHHLKKAKGKSLIVAVDTIVQKLLAEGIVPDFICSIERIPEVYLYFYKDKKIPETVTLVGPPVLLPNIFEEYRGEYVIPLRQGVREYKWLNSILGLSDESYLSMGGSCAHIAFGFAHYVGASPIVFVGQDLAYAQEGKASYSKNTVYDEIGHTEEHEEKIEVDGYFGGKIFSKRLWIDFRQWFEMSILNEKIHAINATEGGSKIEHTIQATLEETIEKYCKSNINVYDEITKCPSYAVDLLEVKEKLYKEINNFKDMLKFIGNIKGKIQRLQLHQSMSNKELLRVASKIKVTDELLHMVYNNDLLMHNLQSEIFVLFKKFYALQEILSYGTVKKNIDIQLEFITKVFGVVELIIEILEKTTVYIDRE